MRVSHSHLGMLNKEYRRQKEPTCVHAALRQAVELWRTVLQDLLVQANVAQHPPGHKLKGVGLG